MPNVHSMEKETNDHHNTLPDPADLPLVQASESLAQCITTKNRPVGPETMLRELRAAMAEFSPGGHFRTPDTRLAAQMAVLDSMFHLGVKQAVRKRQVVVERGTRENNFETKYEDGDPYLDHNDTLLVLRLQNQCRQTVRGMKSSDVDNKRLRLSRRRPVIVKKKKS